MKIALVLLPMWSIDTPPLGIASLAAVLRKEGHSVRTFDFNLKLRRELGPIPWEIATARAWGNVDEFRASLLPRISSTLVAFSKELVAEGYDAVGCTVFESNFLTVSWFATLLRFLKPDLKIAIGGPEVGHHEFHRLAYYQKQRVIDAAVVGEGESSAIGLFGAWDRGESIAGLPGVITEESGKLHFSGRPPALDVNKILPPDFSDFDLSGYKRHYLPIQFSRGCVANCSFCNEKAFLWPTFQMMQANSVVGHMDYLSDEYGMQSFWAVDSLLNGNHAKLNELADLLIARSGGYDWAGNMRIDKRLKPPLSHKLREAGCHTVTFGVESGSNTVLKAMRKGITRDDSIQVIRWMHEAGIGIGINLIVGFPGETEQDFRDTLRLVSEAGEYVTTYNTTIYTIDLLTEVGKNLQKFGIQTDESGSPLKDPTTTYLGNSWLSESGDSTPEIRFNRLIRLRELIASQSPEAVLVANAQG